MKQASKVLALYLVSLLLFSLFFSWIGIGNYVMPVMQKKIQFTPMMIVTIIGGILSLKYTIPASSLRTFLFIYGSLWGLRLLLLFIGNLIGQTTFLNRHLNVDFIIANYYQNVSRLDTPLPFIIYWFIYYFFTNLVKSKEPFL